MSDALIEAASSAPANHSPAISVDDFLESLNPPQRRAVVHGTGSESSDTGPMLVIAGAGSGKTKTVAHRVAHLIRHGADPQRILLLTFSRRAAAEMERRALQLLQHGSPTRDRAATLPWAGTFHGVGSRLLREYAGRIGLRESFSILDRGDAEDLIAITRHDLGFDATKQRFPTKGTCLAVYSRTVNSGTPLKEILAQAYPWCASWEAELKALFAAFVEAKQAQNVLDYDDLLLYWSHMVADAALAREIGARFDYVLVDEYQDTNRLQASILLGMRPDGRGLTVVGDDAQSIYSFRAATVRNILDFPRQFSQPAVVVTLDRNYRSTQAILDASNAVIGLARERFTKNLWTDRVSTARPRLITVGNEGDQARCVADRVLEQRELGMSLRSQAVLFRASSHSAQLELELTRRGIPFVKYGGLRFLEAAHIKDVLSILRWADNPRNRMAGFRAACLVPGVGPATAARLLDALAEASSPLSAMEAFTPPAAVAACWSPFVNAFRAVNAPTADWPGELEAAMQWYEPLLERHYDDAPVRQRDLVQLLQIANTYVSRERFLTEMALDPPDATSNEAAAPGKDDDFLVLSTIHSAKGQEWKSVQILNVVDGCIPSDMSTGTSDEIEEERRLLYVAMTRAREDLALLLPQRFYVHQQSAHGDRHLYASRSRFIPASLVSLFECESWPKPESGAAGTPAARNSAAPIDIGARLRERWR